MSTEITINEDQTLAVKWTGRRGRGSLFQIAAEGNAKNVNRLDKNQILAVFICVNLNPFPLGGENEQFRKIMDELAKPDGRFASVVAKAADMKLGDMRKELVVSAGSGFNAPHDTYISAAVAVLFPEAVETPACSV